MPDYAKTIIYKLINYDYPDLVYIGSTTNFTKRKQHHKEAVYKTTSPTYNRKLYVSIRKNGGWDSWNMVSICDYPCNDKREAEKEEDRYMLELKANLNMIRSFRPIAQYCEDNKDKKKQYREDNKEKSKQYREDNKEKIKQYRDDNKDKMKENQTKKCTCECGSQFTRSNKSQHIKTIKHQKYLNSIGII
jgi:hypothetical protein